MFEGALITFGLMTSYWVCEDVGDVKEPSSEVGADLKLAVAQVRYGAAHVVSPYLRLISRFGSFATYLFFNNDVQWRLPVGSQGQSETLFDAQLRTR